MRKTTALAILVAWGAWACTVLSPQYNLGVRAELNKHWEEAIAYYEKAIVENPREPLYRAALERVRYEASLFYLQEARLLGAQGKRDEAKAAYAKAMAYNPRDIMIAYEAQKLLAEAGKEAEKKPSRIEFPIKLKAKDELIQLRIPAETSLRSVFQALGKAGGVNVVFDENFREVPYTADVQNQPFEQALKSICLATRNFYRIIDEKTVIVVPDQPLKRQQYEVECIKTFYLSNVNAQDLLTSLSAALRRTMKMPIIVVDKGLNSLTIRDTPEFVDLAERIIKAWDKPKSEVMVMVEIMEVARTRLRELGLSFDQNIVGLGYKPATSTDNTTTTGWYPLQGLGLGKAENYSISLPVAYLQFLETDTDTKVIAKPWMRGVADEEIHHVVGQKVPIPKTTFQPFAAGGYAQQPIVSYDFEAVGIEVKLTPRAHFEREVTLTTEINVTALGGTGYADLPIITNRALKGVMRLREGETQIIAGLLRDEERKVLKGIPGLKDIPGIGRLFGAEDTTIEQTDIIIALTPFIVRSIPVGPEDEKPFWVDIEAGGERGAAFAQELLDRELDVESAQRLLEARRAQEQGANVLALSPPNSELPVGREVRLSVIVRNAAEVGTMSLTINYNPKVIFLKDVAEGGFARQLGGNVPFLKNIDNASGMCVIGFSSPQLGRGVRGGGTLAVLSFEAKAAGECLVAVTSCQAAGGTGQNVAFQTSGAQSRVLVR
jgi:general secretion pathway protein D